MPIHTSWKSMVKGMNSYCDKGDKTVCRDFTDGSEVCLCKKGWNAFFATLNKHGWKEGSPRQISETVFQEAVEKTINDFVEWAESYSFKKCMSCSKVPTVEIKWANGKGHAWFCDNCFKVWKKKPNKMSDTGTNAGDVNIVRKIKNGEASRKWSK